MQNCGKDFTLYKGPCKIAMKKTGRKIVPAKLQRQKEAVKSFLQNCNADFTLYKASCKIAMPF